jgi:PHD finger protein 20
VKKNDSIEAPIAESKTTSAESATVKVEIKEELEKKSIINVITMSKKRIGSSVKKSATVTTPKSPDKPTKVSKRLSAKQAGTVKVKTETAPPETPERVKAAVPPVATPKKKNQVVNFVPGSSIEAQNFDGKWMPVKVIEVDMEEREVLVRSCDKNNKSKTG